MMPDPCPASADELVYVPDPLPPDAQRPRGELEGELEDDPPLDPQPLGRTVLRIVAARRRLQVVRSGRWPS